MKNQYLEKINQKRQELQHQLANMDAWEKWFANKIYCFETNKVDIENALRKVGFELVSVKSEGYYNEKRNYAEEQPKMSFGIIMNMIGAMKPTGKPYGNRQYDERRRRFSAKAEKVRLLCNCGLDINFNEYSMESKSEGVLATILL